MSLGAKGGVGPLKGYERVSNSWHGEGFKRSGVSRKEEDFCGYSPPVRLLSDQGGKGEKAEPQGGEERARAISLYEARDHPD